MNNNARKWIEALRSGEFKQGRGRLHTTNGEDLYCCLGVACALYQREVGGLKERTVPELHTHAFDDSIQKRVEYDEMMNWLPSSVTRWLGLNNTKASYLPEQGAPISLADHNDGRVDHLTDKVKIPAASFDEIAAIIESEPKGLFSESD